MHAHGSGITALTEITEITQPRSSPVVELRLLIAELGLPRCLRPSYRDHYLEEPGKDHRQEVVHQRKDEQRHVGDDQVVDDLDCAADNTPDNVLQLRHHGDLSSREGLRDRRRTRGLGIRRR